MTDAKTDEPILYGPDKPHWFYETSFHEDMKAFAEEARERRSGKEPVMLHPADNTVHFATGAVRSADRAFERYDLISPIGMRRLAATCREGAVKYSDYNWEKGMPVSEMLNHAIAHLYKYLEGDRSEDHLAHAAWNCFGAMHSEELWLHLNTNLRGPGCTPPVSSPQA